MTESDRLPTYFISHGGGPWPFMDASAFGTPGMWDDLTAFLRGLDAAVGTRPEAVLVISAHWEEARPTVNAAAHPPLMFDYYGFPEHTYRLAYPAPGSPEIAARVRAVLAEAGIETGAEDQRGFDHGVFIPFMLIYPQADVPLVQLSLRHDLDPAAHLAIGRALAPLRDAEILIIGSGLSYHNLHDIFAGGDRAVAASEHFDAWLTATVEADPAERDAGLIGWEAAPDAQACHPREDHLLPLMVAAGAGGADRGRRVYSDRMFGKAVSAYRFG